MGPKVDKKKGEPEGPTLEGYETDTMTREQVEAVCFRLQEEMKREREGRAFFQLQRDKLRLFWEVARLQLNEQLLRIRNKERGREVGDTQRRKVLKFHDSNDKFLKNEFDKEVEGLKSERGALLKKEQDAFYVESMRMRKERRALAERLHSNTEQQQHKEEELKAHQEALLQKRVQEDAEELQQLSQHLEQHHAELTEALTLKQRVEAAEAEESHKMQIHTLRLDHSAAMAQIKTHCNEANLNNLSLIASLEATRVDAREGHARAMQMREERKQLTLQLTVAREELEHLRICRSAVSEHHL